MRKQVNFAPLDINEFKKKALYYGNSLSHCCYFNNNNIPYLFDPFPHMLMIGLYDKISASGNPFEELKETFEENRDWYVGYFGYDLKNHVEDLKSENPDLLAFDDFHFYRPVSVLVFQENRVSISSYDDPELVYNQINEFRFNESLDSPNKTPSGWKQAMPVDEYLTKVALIKEHILNGDMYEMNFCMEFYNRNVDINPLEVYLKLNEKSPMPFSIYGKFGDNFLCCASPERFLKKEGNRLITQPIKGTARRGKDESEDKVIVTELRSNEKEMAENLMIVDLVRNDLAKSAVPGTVKVHELFGIYTFKRIHQMISTVVAEIKDTVHFIDAVKNAFPMGSMTGAPKVKVMELIELYENSKRGVYSGAAGFITPDGNFDFNVMIRSILYNRKAKIVSFQVGSAITYDSQPEKEYEECLLKAATMFEVLKNAQPDLNQNP